MVIGHSEGCVFGEKAEAERKTDKQAEQQTEEKVARIDGTESCVADTVGDGGIFPSPNRTRHMAAEAAMPRSIAADRDANANAAQPFGSRPSSSASRRAMPSAPTGSGSIAQQGSNPGATIPTRHMRAFSCFSSSLLIFLPSCSFVASGVRGGVYFVAG